MKSYHSRNLPASAIARGILQGPHGGAQGDYEALLEGVTVQGLFIKGSKL